MAIDPDDLDLVPLREIGDVLAEAAMRSMGGPEFLATLAGVHMASSLTQAGFKVVRQAGTHRPFADRRQPPLPLRPNTWRDGDADPGDVPTSRGLRPAPATGHHHHRRPAIHHVGQGYLTTANGTTGHTHSAPCGTATMLCSVHRRVSS